MLECRGGVKLSAKGVGLWIPFSEDVYGILVLVYSGKLPNGCCGGGSDGKGCRRPAGSCSAPQVSNTDVFVQSGDGCGERSWDHRVSVRSCSCEAFWCEGEIVGVGFDDPND